MKWLRFAGQYIDTGIAPAAGYRVYTDIKMKYQTSTQAIFGSRPTNAVSTGSFNLWYSHEIAEDSYFRTDYGSLGDNTAFLIDYVNTPKDARVQYSINFDMTSKINNMEWTSPTNTVGSVRTIYIGSSNNGGTVDSRYALVDIGEFIIYDASDNVVFHGMPVPTGSTEYSGTPAPSNCYWDIVSGSYKEKSGGSNVIWYEDDESGNSGSDVIVQGNDYGLKTLSKDILDITYMNSKYPLFGSDISNPESQFKTYEFNLTGFNSEPSPSFPAYVTDGNFYTGFGSITRTAYTVDTGFKGNNIKALLIQHTAIDNSSFQARAREQLTNQITSESYNSLLNPVSKVVPGLINTNTPKLIVTNDTSTYIDIFVGVQGKATFNTLGNFNGGSIEVTYSMVPQVSVKIDNDGILSVETEVPYNWIQRAYNTSIPPNIYQYRLRWYDWAWFQGTKVTVTVLNTPYVLE